MRILLYTQFCTPEPIFKSVPFARELVRRGHEVRILTGFPNYPGGKIYPGYKLRLWQREILEEIPILRTCLYPSHSRSIVKRLANYGTFAASSAAPLLFGWKPDVVYVCNLVTFGSTAVLNRLLRGVPFAVDVTDLWPDSVFQSGMQRQWMVRILEAWCHWFYKAADRVVAVTPGARRTLAQRGIPENRLRMIPNWADEAGMKVDPAVVPAMRAKLFGDRFTVFYAGNLGAVQGLDAVIDAARIVAGVRPNIQFAFMGKGVLDAELKAKAAAVAPTNTLFFPQSSVSEAAAAMMAADVLLFHLKRNPLWEITIPSKTQAYLAMGKPILSGVAGDASDMVEKAQAGVSCEPENPRSIADAAIRLADLTLAERAAMGERGKEYYHRELSIKVAAASWEQVFAEILAERGTAQGQR